MEGLTNILTMIKSDVSNKIDPDIVNNRIDTVLSELKYLSKTRWVEVKISTPYEGYGVDGDWYSQLHTIRANYYCNDLLIECTQELTKVFGKKPFNITSIRFI
jgi:hypothetical protein